MHLVCFFFSPSLNAGPCGDRPGSHSPRLPGNVCVGGGVWPALTLQCALTVEVQTSCQFLLVISSRWLIAYFLVIMSNISSHFSPFSFEILSLKAWKPCLQQCLVPRVSPLCVSFCVYFLLLLWYFTVVLLFNYFIFLKVILIENKEESLVRAQSRSAELGLENIGFIQANLDNFTGMFHVGVSAACSKFSSCHMIQVTKITAHR